MKRKMIGKIVRVNGKDKYILGKELEEYEMEVKEGLRKKAIEGEEWIYTFKNREKKELEKKKKNE